ncbi:histidine phosphatase family protein [Paenibacillus sp. L3-i20]|uniref:histidine phosphatase family protein n=1 Tax=Paenibacillus sp. L3-i20 TaxID=2905833 RepID=UPI001EDE5738|nr:histidine phosphatase family protein [Paenibacillus sp. L3-i20]GKU79525.1 fructose 1,6-bisphosphatase [Paenibacillus sp. L3-i20]
MLIGIVRHGQTDWNAKGIIQGQTDIPLNEEGISQARALANRLSGEDAIWDAVISSDLMRAHETAKIIAEKLEIPLLAADIRLRERAFGEIEGTTESERLQRYGSDWREQSVGRESDEAVSIRGLEAIEDLMKNEAGRNILIVSHGSFIARMLQVMCADLQDTKLGNLSYSILEREDNSWLLRLHNCTKHLEAHLA